MKKMVIPAWLHWGVGFFCCIPLLYLLAHGALDALDPDPGKTLVHGLGLWALRFLLLALTITPLNRFTPVQWSPLRRTIGLFALAYAVLHIVGYAFFYLGFDLTLLLRELVKRPYIIAGLTAVLILLVLGITSTNAWQRRLGRRWKRLHQLIYVAVVVVLVHFAWQVKAGLGDMPWYAVVFVVLMLLRKV